MRRKECSRLERWKRGNKWKSNITPMHKNMRSKRASKKKHVWSNPGISFNLAVMSSLPNRWRSRTVKRPMISTKFRGTASSSRRKFNSTWITRNWRSFSSFTSRRDSLGSFRFMGTGKATPFSSVIKQSRSSAPWTQSSKLLRWSRKAPRKSSICGVVKF